MNPVAVDSNTAPRSVYYSIGIDQDQSPRERIAEIHGPDSDVTKAMEELEHYVSDPDTKNSPWYWHFYKRVSSAMSVLYPHTPLAARIQMTRECIDDVFNGGYVRVLQSLSVPSGARHAAFAKAYACQRGVCASAVLLLGPRGGAVRELQHFLASEKAHGIHRPSSPGPRWSEQTKQSWLNAGRTSNWPIQTSRFTDGAPLDVAEEHGRLPEKASDALRNVWRRNPALRHYAGTNRLAGDLSYQIIEDAVDVLIQSRPWLLDEAPKARYDQIIEQANQQGVDPFYAAYRRLFVDKDQWRPIWNEARQWLYKHSLSLWESRNERRCAEGRQVAAEGVSFYKASRRRQRSKTSKNSVPGTLYLNNGRYYWVVSGKMKPRPLIDPRTKPKIPGRLFSENGRYYWHVPRWVKRQRLAPKGEKFSTKNRATAERMAGELWNQIKREDPDLAATILKRTRSQGLATKDRIVAEKVAAGMWRQIQQQDPDLAATIRQDNRPKAKDHCQARIKVNGKLRHLGSFANREQAHCAYAREFQRVWGYPPGHNVKTIPKLDKVWPSWQQEKARLQRLNSHPRMPVIGYRADTDLLAQMQKVPWLAEHVIVVFDDNCPRVCADIAIQSRGLRWYLEVKKQGKRPVIQGSASLDRQTNRIRITVFRQGLGNRQVLAEEIYHIGLKIMDPLHPKTLGTLRRWHHGQLQQGGDPTFSIADAFATHMARAYVGAPTSLPRGVTKTGRRLLSPASDVPASIMRQVKANWSAPVLV